MFPCAAGPKVHYFQCDLASAAKIKSVASEVAQQIGAPTVLINNAGFARGASILDTTESELNLTFQINTMSHYYMMQAFLPAMIKQNHGMVITVASLAAYVTTPNLVDYTASKAAALVFHEGLQVRLSLFSRALS
jgi:short-subunit dehydrogenase